MQFNTNPHKPAESSQPHMLRQLPACLEICLRRTARSGEGRGQVRAASSADCVTLTHGCTASRPGHPAPAPRVSSPTAKRSHGWRQRHLPLPSPPAASRTAPQTAPGQTRPQKGAAPPAGERTANAPGRRRRWSRCPWADWAARRRRARAGSRTGRTRHAEGPPRGSRSRQPRGAAAAARWETGRPRARGAATERGGGIAREATPARAVARSASWPTPHCSRAWLSVLVAA
mmetsp:Transcript_40009/g.128982  ORF Transcript_40009/g.128982 Transcript_40009/m.128982 type:complete len:231 (+) Transcript_40009:26-718(+)